MDLDRVLAMARENRRLAATLVSQSDQALADVLNLAMASRARAGDIRQTDAETLVDLLSAEQRAIRDRGELLQRILELVSDCLIDTDEPLDPVKTDYPPTPTDLPDRLIEDAVIDDFSILEVDLEGLMRETPEEGVDNASGAVRAASKTPPITDTASATPSQPGVEPAEPQWMSMVQTTEPESLHAEQGAYVWPEGVAAQTPVRSLLENFGATPAVARDPWRTLEIHENREGQHFKPLSNPDDDELHNAESRLPGPQATATARSDSDEIDVALASPRHDEEAGHAMETDPSESYGLDSEDTDFSIQQETLGVQSDLHIHESVDSWAMPPRTADVNKPTVEDGYLVPAPDQPVDSESRAHISTKVIVRDGAHLATAFTLDLSTSGASLEVEHNYPTERRLHLFIELPSGGAVSTEAEVRWLRALASGYLIGVQFINLNEQSLRDLERVLTDQATV
ncbi:MAG: PilZ domain-containing protein [Myxococcota bacterium]|nr:PilZ domain-containing protein [Myxococcota bacterium]